MDRLNESDAFKEVPFEASIRKNPTLIRPTKMNQNRKQFFKDYQSKKFTYVMKKYMTLFQWGFHKALKILKKK